MGIIFPLRHICHTVSLNSLRVITEVIHCEQQVMEEDEEEISDSETDIFSDQSDSEEFSDENSAESSDEDSSSTDDQKAKLMKLKMDMQKIVGFPSVVFVLLLSCMNVLFYFTNFLLIFIYI